MSAAVIPSKPFPLSNEILRVFVFGREENGRFLPPEGREAATVQVFTNITAQQAQQVSPDLLSTLPNGQIIARVADIFDGRDISFTDAITTNQQFLGNPEVLVNNASRNADKAINDSTLSNASGLNPNESSEETVGGLASQASPESPSAPPRPANTDRDFKENYLIYPADMADGQDRIQFQLHEYIVKSLNFISTLPNLPLTEGERAPGIGPAVPERLNPTTEIRNLSLRTPSESTEKDLYKPIDKPVFLPITNKISDTNSVDWADDKINDFQLRMASISYGLTGGSIGEAGNQLSQLRDYVAEDSGKEEIARALRLYFAGQAVQAQGLLTRASGAIVNPNLELLFQSPQLRGFSFNFVLVGKSQRESDSIKKIIKYFKKGMAPKVSAGPGYFLKSPYVFKIKYLRGAHREKGIEEHKSINRIKMCALQNCSVDYTPMGSYMTYNDEEASMFMYTLSLQFKELTPVYDTDYDSHPIGY